MRDAGKTHFTWPEGGHMRRLEGKRAPGRQEDMETIQGSARWPRPRLLDSPDLLRER